MRLVGRVECQGVDVCGQACGGRGIDTCDMVVHSCLFGAGFDALFDQVNKIGRPQLAQSWEGLCPGIYRETDLVILDDPVRS